MAAFADSGWFLKGLQHLLQGDVDVLNDTLVAIPVSATPDQTADEDIADLTEINSPNARGTISNVSINLDTGNLEVEIDFDDPVMDPVTAGSDFLGWVLAADLGADGVSWVLWYDDTANVTPDGGSITITIPAEGGAKLTA